MGRVRPFPALQPPPPAESSLVGKAGRWLAALGAVGFLLLILAGEQDPTVLIGGALVATFLAAAPTGQRGAIAPLDLLLAALVVGALAYRHEALLRLGAGGVPSWTDTLVAAVFLLALAEAGRRAAGWPALLGVVGWTAALAFRDRLPEPLRAAPLDLVAEASALFYGAGGLFASSFALLSEWVAPIVLFAGSMVGARLVPRLAALLRPYGAAPAATALSAPFLVAPDGRAGAGALPTLYALLPLTPPALGLGALLAGQALGGVGEIAWRLVPPAALALLIVVGRRRADRWRWVWPPPLPALPPLAPATLGIAMVLAAPAALLGLLALLSPAVSFGTAAAIAAGGALIARPRWATVRDLLAGLGWAARHVPLAGALLLFLALVERLNEVSGLLAALGQRWFSVAPMMEALLFSLLALIAGLLFLPAAAVGVVILISWGALPDPPGAIVAALFWIGGASVLAGRWKARALFGRIVWAIPLLLAALVATRAAFLERGPDAALILVVEGAAALAVGLALGTRAPLGAASRFLLLLLGVFLFIPRVELGALLVAVALAVLIVRAARRRSGAAEDRQRGSGRMVSRLRLPRLPRRPA
ncbi:MAG: hypothetical protein RMM58_08475 [Chloroflexota bacterium]|nr:hypothetical protein [Dehalococcoidia bacterium]MDW8253899.1 hypothetical protein [Chloroflexota bacterium]